MLLLVPFTHMTKYVHIFLFPFLSYTKSSILYMLFCTLFFIINICKKSFHITSLRSSPFFLMNALNYDIVCCRLSTIFCNDKRQEKKSFLYFFIVRVVSSWQIPGNRIAGSKSKHTCRFNQLLQNSFPQWLRRFTFPLIYESDYFPTASPM